MDWLALDARRCPRDSIRIGLAVGLCLTALLAPPAAALTPAEAAAVQRRMPIDHSGKTRTGKASYYHHSFAGKTMADGTPMDPHSNNAASKTLPLGTKAKVTNLRNGKSVVVKIKDRGPYVPGRIVDLSPKSAKELGMRKRGVAPVAVAPIAVPQPDGQVKPGDGASQHASASADD